MKFIKWFKGTKLYKMFATHEDVKMIRESVFKDLVKKISFNWKRRGHQGTPYFSPKNYETFGISIRKELPMVSRGYFKFFRWHAKIGWPIYFYYNKLGWKDKFDSPRFEWGPSKYFYIFGLQIVINYMPKLNEDETYDEYWEQFLWYSEYSDNDWMYAKDTWPWIDMQGDSTWNSKFIDYEKTKTAYNE